jgi:hypothetical protein
MIRKHPTKMNDYATLAIMSVCEFLPIAFVVYWLL